jgi:hypothetical protein
MGRALFLKEQGTNSAVINAQIERQNATEVRVKDILINLYWTSVLLNKKSEFLLMLEAYKKPYCRELKGKC